MKVLHLNAGNETGGGMYHLLALLKELGSADVTLAVLEEGELLSRAQAANLKTKLFKQRWKGDFLVFRQIVNFIKAEGIEIIHSHGPRANLLAFFIRRQVDVRWLVTIHSDPRDDFLGQALRGKICTEVNKFIIKQADHLLAISKRFKEVLIGLGIQEEKITPILNGIDFNKNLENPYQRAEFGLRTEDFVLMMVARLEEVKGHKYVLTALGKLVRQHPEVKLLLVGDGSLKIELQAACKKFALKDHLFFLGERPDVDRLYPLADVVILASYSESFPLVLLEAARSEIPIISTKVGAVDELIPNESYGWLIDSASSESIELALKEAIKLKADEKLTQLGKNLKLRSAELFSLANFARSVLSVYDKVCPPRASQVKDNPL